MASFYQKFKTPILIFLILATLIGNGVIASRTWLRGVTIGGERINLFSGNLGTFAGFNEDILSTLPTIPTSIETTVLQNAAFLTLNTLPILETIKPKEIFIDDDLLVSFGRVNITNSGIGNTLLITWEDPVVETLSVIKLYRSTIFGSLGQVITEAAPKQRSFKDADVENGETYYYTLRGVDAGGNEASQLFQYTGKAIDVTPPESPTNIKVIPSPSNVHISWDIPLANDYDFSRVYRSTLPGQLGKLIADSVKIGEFIDTSIIPGVTYYYTVTAIDTSGNESPRDTSPSLARQLSEHTGILAKGDILLLITNIQIQDAGTGNAITLSWSNPTDATFSSVRLYRSVAFNELGVLLADIPSGESSYTDLSATRETVYYYTLRTVDTEGRESDNTIQYVAVTRDITGPAIPSDITVEQTIPSLVDISWGRPGDADLAYYRVYRSTKKEINGHLVANEVTSEIWTDTDIEDNRIYYYIVTAVDTSGNESVKPIPTGIIGGRIPFLPFQTKEDNP